jgi:magnesium transporter
MPRTRLYQDGKLIAEDFPAAEVSDHLEDPKSVVWLDLCLDQGDKLETVSEELSLHPLAVEDAVQPHERPKLDRYEHHLFLSAYKTGVDRTTGEIALIEIAAFITKQALVTVRKSEKFRMDPVVERWDASPDLAMYGVGFLLYGLVDYIVDSHFDAVQALDDEIEGLQDLLFGSGRWTAGGAALRRAGAWCCCVAWCCPCGRW